ncbi:hypothetical protein ABW21_db0200287 [Orbilia brochopaga]|nr:hypothetical protein ABW21_db0200287 [Drechslerella brochopaga]
MKSSSLFYFAMLLAPTLAIAMPELKNGIELQKRAACASDAACKKNCKNAAGKNWAGGKCAAVDGTTPTQCVCKCEGEFPGYISRF